MLFSCPPDSRCRRIDDTVGSQGDTGDPGLAVAGRTRSVSLYSALTVARLGERVGNVAEILSEN